MVDATQVVRSSQHVKAAVLLRVFAESHHYRQHPWERATVIIPAAVLLTHARPHQQAFHTKHHPLTCPQRHWDGFGIYFQRKAEYPKTCGWTGPGLGLVTRGNHPQNQGHSWRCATLREHRTQSKLLKDQLQTLKRQTMMTVEKFLPLRARNARCSADPSDGPSSSVSTLPTIRAQRKNAP